MFDDETVVELKESVFTFMDWAIQMKSKQYIKKRIPIS